MFGPQADHQKKSQKATIKRQVLQNQYFVGLFLLPFGDLDRQKEGIDGQKLVPNSYPDKFFKKGVRFVGNWRNTVGIWRPCIYLIMS